MLKTRVLTSMVLIPLVLAAMFLLPNFYWTLLMLGVVTMGIYEWAVMVKLKPFVSYIYVGGTLAMGLWLTVATNMGISQVQTQVMFWGVLAATIFWVLLVPIWLITRFQVKNGFVMMAIGWLVLLPTWMGLVSLREVSPWLLLSIVSAVVIADSAAYFVGKRFGKHKLVPLISPGKTWEGVGGAWLAVSIYGFVLCWLLNVNYWLIVGLWGITVLSIMGDLLESLIKRHVGVKDSGNLLPGHGGMLDRIDGLTSSLPLATFFIYFPLYYATWIRHV
jgi:phosphatidate cytidylyltransferase